MMGRSARDRGAESGGTVGLLCVGEAPDTPGLG